MDNKLLYEFFQKKIAVHEQSAVKNSFSTYVYNAPDGLFWLNLYIAFERKTLYQKGFTSRCPLA